MILSTHEWPHAVTVTKLSLHDFNQIDDWLRINCDDWAWVTLNPLQLRFKHDHHAAAFVLTWSHMILHG